MKVLDVTGSLQKYETEICGSVYTGHSSKSYEPP